MKNLIWLLPLAIILLGPKCRSSSTTSGCNNGELRFEPPTFVLGQKFTSIGQIYNDGHGLSVNINSMTSSGSFGSGEIIKKPPHPFGTQQILHLNNAVLNIDLKRGTEKVEFEYLEKSGIVNLGAHGGVTYIGSMYTMPASMLSNGVKTTKSSVKEFFNPQVPTLFTNS
jgi:hypothetical protein